MDSKELNTWLMYTALSNEDVSAAQQAIEKGADPNADFAGETALHWAVENGHESLVRVLLEHGANPSPRSRFYLQTPLHIAADHGATRIAELLIEAGAEIESPTNGGWTPLHVAVDQNASEIVGLLLEHGANIDARNNSGESVLHFVENANPELYRFLIRRAKDLNPVDEHEATPLIYAAGHGRNDLVQLLLHHGASTECTDKYGNSAAEMARREGHNALGDFIENPPKPFADEHSAQISNELLQGAFNLLRPYMEFDENKPVDSDQDKLSISRAIEMLERVVEINPYSWSALWFLGLAHRALGNRNLEYDALKRAYDFERRNPDVGRELCRTCIALGKGNEAIQISEHLLSLQPDDTGLIANYGLALLVTGRVNDAEIVVSRSLKINPTDNITINLRNLIQAVIDGRREAPSRWPPSDP